MKKIKTDARLPDGQGFDIKILPAYRPDKAMNVDDVTVFNAYVDKVQQVSNPYRL